VAERPAADPFCPNCGTEVDADARFCPTCGRTLLVAEPEATAADDEPTAAVPRQGATAGDEPAPAIPAAPSWPPAPDPIEPPEQSPPEPPPPTPPAAPPPARDARTPDAPAAGAPPAATRSEPDLPFTWPVMLSGWLIGAGSGLAALTLLPGLGNPLNLLLFVALLAITASIFVADRMPAIPHQRLATFAVLLVALGIALERAAFRVRGIDTIFLVMIVAAAAGAILVELGRDRPMPPPGGAS
jgi:hypothetical protein